jgi:hypothetical protein
MKLKYLLNYGLVLIFSVLAFTVANNLHKMSLAQTTNQIRQPLSESQTNQRIDNLRRILPNKPTLLSDAERMIIMDKAGETRSAEALHLLIKCLAYNHHPGNSNSSLIEQSSSIPAIGIIKQYYGEFAGVSLYEAMLNTEDERLRERIVLTIRTILTAETIARLNSNFRDKIRTTYQGVSFSQMLENSNFKVKLVCSEEKPQGSQTNNSLSIKKVNGVYCDEDEN